MENEEDVQSSATERPNNEHEMDLGKEAENADSDDGKMSSS
jgi:hypothetical protein